jgi:hypothetical protein
LVLLLLVVFFYVVAFDGVFLVLWLLVVFFGLVAFGGFPVFFDSLLYFAEDYLLQDLTAIFGS